MTISQVLSRPPVTAVVSVALGTATGILTNLITETWTWPLALGLLACMAGLVTLQWRAAPSSGEGRRTVVRTVVRRHSRAEGIRAKARNGAHVNLEVTDESTVRDWTADARD